MRELVCLMLENQGMSVVPYSNAEKAELEFALRRFDILITDVSLPTMPSTQLARRLQLNGSDLWVIFCWGYPMQQGVHAWGARAQLDQTL